MSIHVPTSLWLTFPPQPPKASTPHVVRSIRPHSAFVRAAVSWGVPLSHQKKQRDSPTTRSAPNGMSQSESRFNDSMRGATFEAPPAPPHMAVAWAATGFGEETPIAGPNNRLCSPPKYTVTSPPSTTHPGE